MQNEVDVMLASDLAISIATCFACARRYHRRRYTVSGRHCPASHTNLGSFPHWWQHARENPHTCGSWCLLPYVYAQDSMTRHALIRGQLQHHVGVKGTTRLRSASWRERLVPATLCSTVRRCGHAHRWRRHKTHEILRIHTMPVLHG